MVATRCLAGCAIALLAFFAVRVGAEELQRADYKITIPAGSTIDKPDVDIDADHMTTINLSNEATMIVLVLDDKEFAPKAWAKMIQTSLDTLKIKE